MWHLQSRPGNLPLQSTKVATFAITGGGTEAFRRKLNEASFPYTISDSEECRLLGCYAVRALVKTDVSEEHIASIIRMKRIRNVAVASNRSTRWMR
jgi:hypothetical protein